VPHTRKILLLLSAVGLLCLGFFLIDTLDHGDRETATQPPPAQASAQAGGAHTMASPSPSPARQSTSTPAPTASPNFPVTVGARPSTPTAMPTLEPPSWTLSRNRYGIHLLLDDDRNHWLPEVWPQHLQAARQIVGEGGYVIQLIRLDDLNVQRWQSFLDLCAGEHLIPIIRLATTFDHENKWWQAPPKDADDQGYTQVARQIRDFLVQLQWPGESRYVIVHNEANRGDEWSNQPDPAEYARFLLDVGQALQEDGFSVLGPALDMYAPHTNGQLIDGYRYIDAETFLDGMALAEPGVFDVIDIWASHAYPLDPFRFDPSRQEFRIDYAFGASNPGHLEPPEGLYNRGINSYRWELWRLEQIIGARAATLPVFITETGWRHSRTQDENARDHVHAEIPFELQSAYLDLAFYGNGGRYPGLPETGWTPWSQDSQVMAVVLFALGGFPKDWGHTNWVEVDGLGQITGRYPLSLPVSP